MNVGQTFKYGKYTATVVGTKTVNGLTFACAKYWVVDSVSGKRAQYPSFVHFKVQA